MIVSINSKSYSGVTLVTEKGYPENSLLIRIENDKYKVSDFNELFTTNIESVKLTRESDTIDLSEYKYVDRVDRKINNERNSINITLVTNPLDIVDESKGDN